MSYQRSLGMSKNNFWYLNMILASTQKWYYSLSYHIRGDKWSCAQFFFGWNLISAILDFLYHDLHVSYRGFLVMDQNWKIWALSDKMKNNISIVLIISSFYCSSTPPPPSLGGPTQHFWRKTLISILHTFLGSQKSDIGPTAKSHISLIIKTPPSKPMA